MMEQPHKLERTIHIHARPDTVFRFFTDSERWAAWWGPGSTIDARVGGALSIRYPNGIEAGGEVLELEPPSRIAFSYGYASGEPIGVGASKVVIRLQSHATGTELSLTHELPTEELRDQHIQGWRYQLSVFANVVADQLNAQVAERIDGWLAAFSEPDGAAREAGFREVARQDVCFNDRYSCVQGIVDLLPHTAALQQFLPGVVLRRRGDVRHCQGLATAEWEALRDDDQVQGSGTNVYRLDADGVIVEVTGFWH